MFFSLQDSCFANSFCLTRFFKKLFHNVSCIAHCIVGPSASTGVTHCSNLLKLSSNFEGDSIEFVHLFGLNIDRGCGSTVWHGLLLKGLALVIKTLKQLLKGIDELLHALLLELAGDLLIVDPVCLERIHDCLRLLNMFFIGET